MEVTKIDRKITPRPDTKKKMKKFLKILEGNPDISKSARQMGLTYLTVYRWRQIDPLFDKKVNETIDAAIDMIEDSFRSNAINKYDEEGNLIQKGDFLQGMAVLKAKRPNIYGDRQVIEHKTDKDMIRVIPAFVEEAKVIENGSESK
jgi:hypothetical protein